MDFLRDEEGKHLFAQVVAQPGSNGPRAVLSDWLIERGDPFGEFIALQLKGSRSKRVTELRRKHEADWLGPIHEIADGQSIRFKDGFLSSFIVDSSPSEPHFEGGLDRALGHPALSLVTSLTLFGVHAQGWVSSESEFPIVAFLAHPVFDRLKSVSFGRLAWGYSSAAAGLSEPLVEALEKVRPGIVRV